MSIVNMLIFISFLILLAIPGSGIFFIVYAYYKTKKLLKKHNKQIKNESTT
jgi:uncharacterized membrane protein